MNRKWNIINWNVRGINSQDRWDDLGLKIEESACNIMCFRETKKEIFDQNIIKNFFPRRFNKYVFEPSTGSSGGLIIIWNGHTFTGRVISQNYFHIIMEFTYNISGTMWHLTNVYGPNSNNGKLEFTNWLTNIDVVAMDYWMIMGDFKLIRGPEDRNRPGGDHNNMMLFNSIILQHDLMENTTKRQSLHME